VHLRAMRTRNLCGCVGAAAIENNDFIRKLH
jgi:hypothetical protein